MRSTKVFLDSPYQAPNKHNKHRAAAVEQRLQKERAEQTGIPLADAEKQVVLLIPDDYLDFALSTVMHQPHDIRLCDKADAMHVDSTTLRTFREEQRSHPASREPILPRIYHDGKYIDPYPINMELAGCISAFITIEELKLYVADCELQRQQNILQSLNKKSDEEASQLLAQLEIIHVADLLQHMGIALEDVPAHFFGHNDGVGNDYHKVMTLPVILDGKHHIDFLALVKTFPKNRTLTVHEQGEHAVALAEEKKKTIEMLEKRCASNIKRSEEEIECKKAKIAKLENDVAADTDQKQTELARLREELKSAIECLPNVIKAQRTITDQQIKNMQKMDADSLFEAEEYMNPFTGMPIQSIAVNFALLKEIDCFVDPFERQMKIVRETADKHDFTAKPRASYLSRQKAPMQKQPDEKSYAETLADEEYEYKKIPDGLAKGCIPGQNHAEIMNHPVLLDGTYWIDLERLQEYWKPVSGLFFGRAGCYGINPFTKEPIKTITYDEELKYQTDNFMLNRAAYSQITTEEKAKDPKYLCTKPRMFSLPGNILSKSVGFSSLIPLSIVADDAGSSEKIEKKN